MWIKGEERMKYHHTTTAKFIERPNRFIAKVLIEGKEETVHVKNTGRCKELLIPGCEVILEEADNRNRKTKYDLIAVYKEGLGWVNIDSQIPNAVVKEWLLSDASPFSQYTFLKSEYTYGKSRIDFYFEMGDKKILMEVKGCTLEVEGEGYFPDAPTERGVKHLQELAAAQKKGYECYLAFVIAMPKVKRVHPNMATHPEFGTALELAKAAGVKVLYLTCEVTPNEIKIQEYTISNNEMI